MLPRLLLPTARSAFALTLVAAAAGVALSGGRFQPPGYSTPSGGFALSLPQISLPSFVGSSGSGGLPNLGSSAPPIAPEMQVHPDLLRLDDVLPLNRDLELDLGRSGALDNPQAAKAWPDSDSAVRRLEDWGRTGGFQATFVRRRPGTPDNTVVLAWADVSTYRTSKGALDALNDLAARLMKQGATTITGASIGDGSVTLRQVTGSMATLHVLFRDGSAGVWIAVTGEAGSLQQEPVERLANVLSERIG